MERPDKTPWALSTLRRASTTGTSFSGAYTASRCGRCATAARSDLHAEGAGSNTSSAGSISAMPAPGNPDRASHAARRKQHPLFIIPEVRPTLVSSFNGRSFPSDPCVPEGKGAAIFSRACRIPSFFTFTCVRQKGRQGRPPIHPGPSGRPNLRPCREGLESCPPSLSWKPSASSWRPFCPCRTSSCAFRKNS